MNTRMRNKKQTSWQPASKWYTKSIGLAGNYYHQHVILPSLMRLMKVSGADSILDLGCGQGVLERALPKNCSYLGIDVSSGLITFARQHVRSSRHTFMVADVTRPLPIPQTEFTHAVFLLSLQNMDNPVIAIKNAADRLAKSGKLFIILNHPCFRIPRQSSWQIDEAKKLEYRRIDRYLSPLKIPITTNPGMDKNSSLTWSFHHPLSDYFRFIHEAGLATDMVEEWSSDKESEGKVAKMENRARAEFPLFLTIVARKSQ